MVIKRIDSCGNCPGLCHDNGPWKLVQYWYAQIMMTELVGLNTPAKVDGLIGKEYCTFAIIEHGDVGDPKAS